MKSTNIYVLNYIYVMNWTNQSTPKQSVGHLAEEYDAFILFQV